MSDAAGEAPRTGEQSRFPGGLVIGLDVGSTTVKVVVVEPGSREPLWSDYQFHETRQADKVLQLLKAVEHRFPLPSHRFRIFATGSGAATIAPYLGARFVQEVNAVALAAETFHPDVGSVIELGGQDAKIIVFKEDPESGRKKKDFPRWVPSADPGKSR